MRRVAFEAGSSPILLEGKMRLPYWMHEEAGAACRNLGDHGGKRAAEKLGEQFGGVTKMQSFSGSGGADIVAICKDGTAVTPYDPPGKAGDTVLKVFDP